MSEAEQAPLRHATKKHRRPLSNVVLHAPQVLRALVRTDEIWLVVLAAFAGCFTGIAVWLMTETTQMIHELLFEIGHSQRLSAMVELNPWRTVLVPALGGLLLGIVTLGINRVFRRRTVDPIEANALFGGRMSLNGSLIVVLQTIISNGVGASIGLEAGYTQIGASIASRWGHGFRLRRNDLRLLVGCGAAAAIAGAFNAPLTGAFYAFELVVGTYTLGTFAPVAVAAIVSVAVVRLLGGAQFEIEVLVPSRIDAIDYIPILALGMLCALVGIAIMRGVTITEELFRKSRVAPWLRPAIGGLAVGLLALYTPAVLSSGHGALGVVFGAVSPVVCALVGMSALAVGVIGGPLTMGFLALEATGSLPMTAAVLAACVVSALTVRRTFGYSFATWRFHLRGEAIRSAVDIGWMRNLTVERMMRREVPTVHEDMEVATFKHDFPLGSAQIVVVLDDRDRYAGIVHPSEVHADSDDHHHVELIRHHTDTVLLPKMTIKEAVAMFENAESDALAVVDGTETRKVIGLLTEAHALRRYSEELDRRRRELSGE